MIFDWDFDFDVDWDFSGGLDDIHGGDIHGDDIQDDIIQDDDIQEHDHDIMLNHGRMYGSQTCAVVEELVAALPKTTPR